MLAKILQGKARMQLVVQEMVALRAAAKGQRASSLAGAASSVGGAAASGSLAGTGGGRTARDPERALQERMAEVAGVLRHDVSKPEEGAWGCCCRRWVCHLAACLGPPADCSLGRFAQCSAWALPPACLPPAGLQRLIEQKDNHVFRGLATLAAFGCTYKDALAGERRKPLCKPLLSPLPHSAGVQLACSWCPA